MRTSMVKYSHPASHLTCKFSGSATEQAYRDVQWMWLSLQNYLVRILFDPAIPTLSFNLCARGKVIGRIVVVVVVVVVVVSTKIAISRDIYRRLSDS